MGITELRKQIIGCATLEEMRTVWQILKDMGETMYRFSYTYGDSLNLVYSRGIWCNIAGTGTLSFKNFIAEFGQQKNVVDMEWLRTQRIGPLVNISEVFEAHWLLASIGEESQLIMLGRGQECRLSYNVRSKIWASTFSLSTLSLSDFKEFVDKFHNRVVKEVTPPLPTHDCSLHWSVIQDCCLKCNPEQDVRNNPKLWGLLDEQRRHDEFIAAVRANRKGPL